MLLRIVATALDPSFHYKTLACTSGTTSYDAVCLLVKKYSIRMEDQSPQSFYLMEVGLNVVNWGEEEETHVIKAFLSVRTHACTYTCTRS